MTAPLILYAPNVHTGGGFVLLRALLQAWPNGQALHAFLDERARATLPQNSAMSVHWVRPSARSRWQAERALRIASTAITTVLCFHGLPPVLPNAGRVVVFQQNRNYLGMNRLSQFGLRTAVRLAFERLISRLFRHRVAKYLVQSPTMARDLANWYGKPSNDAPAPPIDVVPFIDDWPKFKSVADLDQPTWDFVYVSDGEAHKNHRTLLAAWRLLAQQGLKPTLALTLGARDQRLVNTMEEERQHSGAALHNLGRLPREQVLDLYRNARALIFPSTSESFGLPLVEATRIGLPIIASELDFVRDVCVPVQTFDPESQVSIARAVRRFLGQPEPSVALYAPAEFWSHVLGTSGR